MTYECLILFLLSDDNSEQTTALHEACEGGHAEIVRFLLQFIPGIQTRALREDTVRILILKGIPLTLYFRTKTPLQIAALVNSFVVIQELLQFEPKEQLMATREGDGVRYVPLSRECSFPNHLSTQSLWRALLQCRMETWKH